jgi:hypothetical protein
MGFFSLGGDRSGRQNVHLDEAMKHIEDKRVVANELPMSPCK